MGDTQKNLTRDVISRLPRDDVEQIFQHWLRTANAWAVKLSVVIRHLVLSFGFKMKI